MLLDTGPLVSFLADGLVHHAWAVEQWKQLRPPMLTCEPVLPEAAFLLKREGRDTDVLFALLERGIMWTSRPTFGRSYAGIAIGRCLWQTLVWCDFRNSTPQEKSSRSTRIFASTGAMATKLSRC